MGGQIRWSCVELSGSFLCATEQPKSCGGKYRVLCRKRMGGITPKKSGTYRRTLGTLRRGASVLDEEHEVQGEVERRNKSQACRERDVDVR